MLVPFYWFVLMLVGMVSLSLAQNDRARAEVRLGEQVICHLTQQEGLPSVEHRARAATRALERALHREETSPPQMKLARDETGRIHSAEIFAGDELLLRLTEGDVPEDSAFDAYARETFQRLRLAFSEEQMRSRVARQVLAVSTVIFLGLVALLLLRLVRNWSKRGRKLVKKRGKAIGPVRLGLVELLPAQAARESMRVGLYVGSWFIQAVLLYAWGVTSLSMFDATRDFAEKATGKLFGPALEMVGRVAGQVPVVFALLFALIIVALIIRFTAAYFSAIERREVEVDWVRPEVARVTGGLVSLSLAIAGLLFVAPLLTGSDSGVLTRIGELALGVLALSVVPLLCSCVLGVRLGYVHVLRHGDRVVYGGRQGEVEQIGIFCLVIRGGEGQLIFVPHLFSLWHATEVFPDNATSSLRSSDSRPPPSARGEQP